MRLFLALLAATFALVAPAASWAATVAVTPTNIAAAKGAAMPGDRLVFTGAFGDVIFKNVKYDPPLTLDLTAATLGGLKVDTSAGIDTEGGDITADAWWGPAYVVGSQHVHLRGLTTHGDGKVNAVTCRSSQDVSLENAVLFAPRVGFTMLDCATVAARSTTVIGASVDGFDTASSEDVVIEYNVCVGSAPQKGMHPDCWQGYSNPAYRVSDRITVRYNVAYGDTQGFTTFGPTGSAPVKHLVMEHNQVFGAYPQGIGVNAPDAIVRWNAAHTLPGSAYPVRANVTAGVACENTSDATVISGVSRPAKTDGACQ